MSGRRRSRWSLVLPALGAVATLWLGTGAASRAQDVAPAAAAARELLNSERIERTFGTFGIEVLESDASLRVSSLYSLENGERICRTFAVVRFPPVVEPRMSAEHRAIVAGQPIGATFAEAGWQVVKTHRYFGEIAGSPRLAMLMGGVEAPQLAVHVYDFAVSRDGVRFTYAAIAEVHHPDYLDVAALREIYGPAALAEHPDAVTRELLELVVARSR